MLVDRWQVHPKSLPQGHYEAACGCGMPASTAVSCKHMKKVMRACQSPWQGFSKPFQTVSAWQQQIGPAWDEVELCEIVEAVRDLRCNDKLLAIVHEPKIAPGRIGRPATKSATVEENTRAKSFLEDLDTHGREAASVRDVFSAQGGRNPGGKSVPKRCSRCRNLGRSGLGHRANRCPFDDGDGVDDSAVNNTKKDEHDVHNTEGHVEDDVQNTEGRADENGEEDDEDNEKQVSDIVSDSPNAKRRRYGTELGGDVESGAKQVYEKVVDS